PPCSDIGVKIATVASCSNEAGANGEIAKMFVAVTLGRIGGKKWIEPFDDRGMIEVLGIELGKARAVECGAQIKVVATRRFSDEADLSEIRSRATVGAAGHPNDDV